MHPDAASPGQGRIAFRGRFVEVAIESWSGSEWEVVRRVGPASAGAVGVLALTPESDVLLVRQFRQPVRAALLEIPAGLLDVHGEPPEACAERELLEETGFRPGSLEPLGWFYSSAGMTDERFALFAAWTPAEPETEPEEGIELVRMPFEEARRAIRDGRIVDSKTALAIALASSKA